MTRLIALLPLFAMAAAAFDEKPVTLLSGMGLHQHAITTNSPEAQKFFNQGLVLLYGFNRYEAQRSFRKAAELDSAAIMPQVGLAWTYAPHINMDLDGDVDLKKACAAAQQATERHGPARERAYAKAAAALCTSAEAYSQAMRELSRQHPDDHDAATLYAETLMVPVRWRWWQQAKPAGEMAECIRVLEGVMRRDPDHPGANHFYVHAMEMSPNPEYALPAAQRLMGGIAPNAGHLVHMAGHIYIRTGDWEVVASSNERAVSVDEHYFHHTGVQGGYMGYYAHNIHFLVAARMMQGRYDDALAAARKMVSTSQPMLNDAAALLEAWMPYPWFVMLRFEKWDDLLAQPPLDHPKLPITKALYHWGRAVAWNGKGDRAKAAAEAQTFAQLRAALPADAIWINNKAADILQIAADTLSARMASSPNEAIPFWKRAVERQDALIYEEPPAWYYPIRESLGAALLASGDAKAAEAVFREELANAPRNPRALHGLMTSLEKQGRTDDAALVRMEFDRAARKAQMPLNWRPY